MRESVFPGQKGQKALEGQENPKIRDSCRIGGLLRRLAPALAIGFGLALPLLFGHEAQAFQRSTAGREKKLTLSLGAGAISTRYIGQGGAFQPRQISIIAKLGATLLLGKRLEVEASGFTSAFHVQEPAQNGVDPAQVYELTGKVGLRFPMKALGGSVFKFSSGGMVGGMKVPNDVYGMWYLLGPIVELSLGRGAGGKRGYYVYARFSPTTESLLSLSMVNRGLFAGLGLQINSTKSKRALYLTVDGSDTLFSRSTVPIHWQTLRAGLQLNF